MQCVLDRRRRRIREARSGESSACCAVSGSEMPDSGQMQLSSLQAAAGAAATRASLIGRLTIAAMAASAMSAYHIQ